MTGDMITVFGGSGFVGKHVVRALCKQGQRVRVATRRPHLAHELRVMGDVGQVQLMQANIRRRESVARAVEGADGVVNLVGVLFQAGPQKFKAVHTDAAGLAADEAKQAGVTRFVQMSAIGADPKSKSIYGRTKAAGEAVVREAFPEAVILRPSIVFGPEDAFFNRFADMARFAPALPLIGGGKTLFQPVYAGDVAAATAAALTRADVAGRIYELGGPRSYTFKELMQLMLKEIDRPRWLAPVPYLFAYGLGLGGELSGKLPFIEPFLTRDQVTLLKKPNVVSDDEAIGRLADLGVETPATVEAILPTYMERYRKYGQFHERRV